MKKVLTLCFIILFAFIFVGCESGTGQGGGETENPEIDYATVNELKDSIDILYLEKGSFDFSNQDLVNEIQRIKETYNLLKQEEKDLITNYSDFEEIIQEYDAYLKAEEEKNAEKKKVEDAVEAAAELAKNSIPKTSTGEKIELPTSYVSDEGINVYIGWQSSDPLTISTNGVVTQPRTSTSRVTLTAIVRSGSVQQTVKGQVAVGILPYEKLPSKPVFAYYYTNQRLLNEIERKTINVINLSFAGLTSNGEVTIGNLNYSTVLQERKNGIRVCFSIQDAKGNPNFGEWTSTPEKREKLVKSIVDFNEKYHFDGVDIDWEYPLGNQVANYVELMKLLYEKIKEKNKNYLVTSAMYGGNGVSKYDAGVSYKYMDYIHLMTYDLNALEVSTHLTALGTGPLSSTSVKSTIAFYTGAGIPKEKLVIGGAFYGKVYELSSSATSFLKQPLKESVDGAYTKVYSAIKTEYLSKINSNDKSIKVVREWDSAAQAPYLCVTKYDSNNNVVGKEFITYDDAESLKLKAQYVFDEGLAGMMFWELGYEDRETNELVTSIYNVFYK